jgi:Glyoxalase-like domain
MWLRLRQIALIADDIEAVVDHLKSVLGLEVGFVDPHISVFGLQNRLLPVGSQFLEVVSPIQEGTTGGRYLERRGGDGGYMVICQAEDHEAVKRRVAELGIRKVAERDTDTYNLLQMHPQDTGGSFLEVDWHSGADEAVPPWTHAAGDDWQKAVRTEVVSAITAAEIQGPDPEKVAARWSEVLQSPVRRQENSFAIRLDNAALRFVEATDGRGEGLGGVDLKAVDRERAIAAAQSRSVLQDDGLIHICGTRFRLI